LRSIGVQIIVTFSVHGKDSSSYLFAPKSQDAQNERILQEISKETLNISWIEECAHKSDEPVKDLCHRRRRYAWAELLKRVFAVDVLQCDHCGGRMRILARLIRLTR